MKTKEQKLPKWFNGEIYDKGAVVENRFGGDSIELNNLGLLIIDEEHKFGVRQKKR